MPEKQGRPSQKSHIIPAEDDKENEPEHNDGFDMAPRRQTKGILQDSPPQTSKKESDARHRMLDVYSLNA